MSRVMDNQYQLERGKPMPSEIHGYIQGRLIARLYAYEDHYNILSELSLELNNWGSVPDIAIYPKRKMNFREDRTEVTTPPLCAIEILSPSQSLQELVNKASNYFQHGVKSCWLVIPSLENIYVFSSPETYSIFRSNQMLSDTALGIELELAKIFS
jgi:Uma2 family endonuclease